MKGCIWSTDRAGDGIKRLQMVRDRYHFMGVNSIKEVYSRSSSWIEFENGDIWRVASPADCARAIRANYAWIDSRITNKALHTIVMRTLTLPDRYYEFYMAEE